MENSGIGWTDHTWNPWQGCNKVSDACKYCYIGGIMKRAGREPFRGPMRTAEATWKNPYRWNRAAEQAGRRVRVFTCSMSDFFHAGADDWREEAWSVIRDCQSIDWLVLTKRADRIVDHLPADWGDGFPNVWLGVTVESRSHLRRVELLSRIPAAVRWCLRNRFCNRLISARTWGRSTGSSRAVKRRTKTSVGTWTSIGCVASGTSARPHEFRTSSSSITSAIKSKRTECSTGGSARSGLRPDRASDR